MNFTTRMISGSFHPVLAIALAISLLCGCGGEDARDWNIPAPVINVPFAPTPPAVVTPPCAGAPPLPAECGTIEFQVYTVAGSVADAKASILIQPDTGGAAYSYGLWHGELHSDQAGNFVTKPVPPATLTLRVFAPPGYYFQPCAAVIRSPSSIVTQIQIIPSTAFDTAEAPRPSNATEPSLAGTVYEMTSEGRKPVSGAFMMIGSESNPYAYWWFDEDGIATALSSLEGHFYFCSLPPGIQIYVAKPGFEDAFVHPGDFAVGVPLDIELRRSGT
jgi:hypothetical protein